MRKIFEFLYYLAGLYAGISLIFMSYAQWLSSLFEFINEPAMITGLETSIWLCLAGTATALTSKLIE